MARQRHAERKAASVITPEDKSNIQKTNISKTVMPYGITQNIYLPVDLTLFTRMVTLFIFFDSLDKGSLFEE